MTNFVLTGLPNFIVVGLPWQPSLPRPGSEPVHLDADLSEVLRLLAIRSDVRRMDDAVLHNEASRVALQRVIDRFGFERHPATYAELYGLFEYCDRLTALSGIGVLPIGQLAAWQSRSLPLVSRARPPCLQAVEMYCSGDFEGLKRWHREPDTLLGLGRAYRLLP
jgi:hypothetical protein